MRCDQCQQLRINGVVCHETGCPNAKKRWMPEREAWVRFVDCFECGYPVEFGEHCDCQDVEEVLADDETQIADEEHLEDSDCDVDTETRLCRVCGVYHDEDPCRECGSRAFHREGCAHFAALPLGREEAK